MTKDDVHLLFIFLCMAALIISPVALIFIVIIWIGVTYSEN